MRPPDIRQDWLYPPSLIEATKIQRELAQRVLTEDQFNQIDYIGGMDVSNNLYDPAQMIYAGLVLLDSKNLQVCENTNVHLQQKFPYVPGFLGFREAPPLVAAYQNSQQKPDIIMVDGHGISHPRRLGIAAHIGVLLDCPTIGVAKSILVGKIEGELSEVVGAQAPLMWKGQQIAVALRTKARALPLYISPGHKVSFESAIALVKQCLTKYRLPEPTRQAHLSANDYRKFFLKSLSKTNA